MKAKLPRVERKVIVQERFTSPWNIAVWVGYMMGNIGNIGKYKEYREI